MVSLGLVYLISFYLYRQNGFSGLILVTEVVVPTKMYSRLEAFTRRNFHRQTQIAAAGAF
jgi:hypothetical protein